jgi:predicted transcriptional regulator
MALTQNQIKSIELLLSGMAQNQVAKELGVTPKTLQRWAKISEYSDKLNGILKDATEQATKQATETVKQKTIDNIAALGDRDALRQEQYQKLQIAQNALMLQVEEGDCRAIAVYIKLSESIRLLYGLNVKNDILDAFEILVKAKVLPYKYLNKFQQYSYEYERKIKGIGDEPPDKISYNQSKPDDEYLDKLFADIN